MESERNETVTMFGGDWEQVEYNQCNIVVLIHGVSTHQARIFLLVLVIQLALVEVEVEIWVFARLNCSYYSLAACFRVKIER